MSDDRPTEADTPFPDDLPTAPMPDGPGRSAGAGAPQVDGYRPVEKIGEGGFGEVWLAEQLRPVRRNVALKLIKAGMDSRQVLARFESERQALALMEHPAIAKVFDAGTTRLGRPYFAMEYVRGLPITWYCDRHRLDTNARLELFGRVCEGVQHAHHKAILHRDLKPSNILVTEGDGAAQPKIIDFGVAKATGQRLTERTLHTRVGHMVGTPEYMSPEQAGAAGEDVDTRTDVYSLGVVLYELLVGVLPVDSRKLRDADYDEIRRRIREDEAPRPSTRMSTLGDASATTASNRRTDPPTLLRLLRGDLDWIVMRALAKERSRRYGSPAELAADIRRHLANEPVLARPPSIGYRTRKFVLRHRLAASAAAFMLVALLTGLALATHGLVRATRAEARARADAEHARRVAGFMVDLFEAPDPGEARGNSITAREVLDRGVARIGDELRDQPAIRAALLQTMGRVYTNLGLYKEALPLAEQAVRVHEERETADPETLAAALDELATVRTWLGEYDEAIRIARRALRLRESAPATDPAGLGVTLNALANALQNSGALDEAEPLHRRAIAVREAALGADHVLVASSLHNLAIVHYQQRAYAESERLYRRAIEIEAAHGEDNHRLATSLHTLSILLGDMGRHDEAVPLAERALAIRERVLGPDHPHVSYSLTYLGLFRTELGEPERAEPALRRAVAIASASWSPVYAETRWMRRALAASLAAQGEYAEAEAALRALLAESEGTVEETALPSTLNALGGLLAGRGRFDEGAASYRRAIEIDERLSGPDSPWLVPALQGLADLECRRGRADRSIDLYRRAATILEGAGESGRRDLAGLLDGHAACLDHAGSTDEADGLRRRAAALREVGPGS